MKKIVELTQAETEAVVGGLAAQQPSHPFLRLFAILIRRIIGGGKPVAQK